MKIHRKKHASERMEKQETIETEETMSEGITWLKPEL